MPNYIELLNLKKHIEGGYFSVFYKSEDQVTPLNARYRKNSDNILDSEHRSAGSSIYFMLEKNDFSAWHKLKSDEIWHYYDGGSPLDIHVINTDGHLVTFTLGNPTITENASFQVVIKASYWFAAEVRDKTSFGLVGCTVSPGFEYHDFEVAKKNELIEQFRTHEVIIKKFTRPE